MTETTLRKWEGGVAGVLTLVAAGLHLDFVSHAGGLWRDEANTVGLATLPQLSEVWSHLQYDSFPVLWLLVVRAVSAISNDSEAALRWLGCGVGLTLLGMLWLHARAIGNRVPLLSLVLLGLCPSLIIYGDSLRAYGFGIVLILLTFSLLWRFMVRPTPVRYSLALLGSLLSVHALYYNAVLILAACSGAIAVAATRRHWAHALQVLALGGVTALSLLPYAKPMRQASEWNSMVRLPVYDLGTFLPKLHATLVPAGNAMLGLWLVLLLTAVIIGFHQLRSGVAPNPDAEPRGVILNTLTVLLVGIAAYYLFLKLLRYPTQPWYYLALIALVAVNVDALLGAAVAGSIPARRARLIVVILLAVVVLPNASRSTRIRLTNVDQIAATLATQATADDLIVVRPWYCGVTFARYHQANVPWMCLPDVSDRRFHRYDQVRDQMRIADQNEVIRPVREAIARTLQAGHRVFLVGGLDFVGQGQAVPPLPTPLEAEIPWAEPKFLQAWSLHVGQFVQLHVEQGEGLPVPVDRPVAPLENLPLVMVQGWRP